MSQISSVPLICSGGAGELSHVLELINSVKIDGAAFSNLLHIEKLGISELKDFLQFNQKQMKIRA